MSVQINVDVADSGGYSRDIKSAADYFQQTPLVPEDGRTTLSANRNGKCSYYIGQEAIDLLGDSLTVDAANIESLGLEFSQYDELLTKLYESGQNGCHIVQG